jgi:phosphotransferase system HPr (HPr) family protein
MEETLLLTVKNQRGIHGRPSQKIAEIVKGFPGHNVTICSPFGNCCDASNEKAIMVLGLEYGDEIKITISGQRKAELAEELKTLIEDRMYVFECRALVKKYVETYNEIPEIIADLLIQSRPEDLKTWHLSVNDKSLVVRTLQQLLNNYAKYSENSISEFGRKLTNFLENRN